MHSGPVESDHYYFRTLPEDLGLPSCASRCSVWIILHYSHSPPSSCLLLLFLQSSRLAIDPVPCPVLALLRVRITLQAFPHSLEYNPVLLLAFAHPPALIRLGPSSTIPPIPCICPHFLPPSRSTFRCHHQISGPSSGSFLYEPSRMMSHYASRSSYIHAHVLSLFTDLPSPLPSHPVTLRSLRPSTGSVTGLRPPDRTRHHPGPSEGEIIEVEVEAYVVKGMSVPILLGEDFQMNYELGISRNIEKGTKILFRDSKYEVEASGVEAFPGIAEIHSLATELTVHSYETWKSKLHRRKKAKRHRRAKKFGVEGRLV
ncbi:hypothetical protein C8J57DRAFT_1541133 [Mycena rebaudengoi]|nr:hypothetical protein C8J57DRAFT_1541133 [Mycena rebaudengoi]